MNKKIFIVKYLFFAYGKIVKLCIIVDLRSNSLLFNSLEETVKYVLFMCYIDSHL